MVYACDDFHPQSRTQSRIQLTIGYPDTVLGS
jgi:hypothetical protein